MEERQRVVIGRRIFEAFGEWENRSIYDDWLFRRRNPLQFFQPQNLQTRFIVWRCQTNRNAQCVRAGLAVGTGRGLIASGDCDKRVFVHETLEDIASLQLNNLRGPQPSPPLWGRVSRLSPAESPAASRLVPVWSYETAGAVRDLALLPGASLIASASAQPVLTIHEIGRDQPLLALQLSCSSRVVHAAERAMVFVGLANGRVSVVDPRLSSVSLICSPLSGAHSADVTSITSRDSRLFTGGRDGTLRLWDLRRPNDLLDKCQLFNAQAVRGLDVSPNGEMIVARSTAQSSLRLIRTTTAGLLSLVNIHVSPSNVRDTKMRQSDNLQLSRINSVFVNLSNFYRGALGLWTGGDAGNILLIELKSGLALSSIDLSDAREPLSILSHPSEGLVCSSRQQDPIWCRPN